MRSQSRLRIVASVLTCVVIAGAGAGAYLWWSGWFDSGRNVITPVSRQRPSDVFYLAAPGTLPGHVQRAVPALLSRELQRQAVLMAARDGLGMDTRDGVLRETPPSGKDAAAASLRLDPDFLTDSTMPITLREDSPGGATLLVRDVPLHYDDGILDLLKLAQDAEAKSRGEYLDLLRKCGFSGGAKQHSRTSESAPADDLMKAEQELGELNVVSQFSALRRARVAIRASGPSPAWLGVLVRGYANLGQLTWYQWNAFHQVFAARALLYAQRMVVDDPHSAPPLWHRAYALAMVGLHRQALNDLEEAGKRGNPAMPRWAKVIEPLCRYQTGALADMASAHKEDAPLAMYACFLTVEHCGSAKATIDTARAALEVNPRCMRLVDSLCENAGVSALHVMTEDGPAGYRAGLAGELRALEPFPAGTTESLDALRSGWRDPSVVAKASEALVNASAPAEPSWSAVGRELQAINFVHVQRRAEFMARKWAVDASQFVDESMPLVRDDPFAAVIQAYACFNNGQPDVSRLTQLTRNLEIPDPRPPMQPAWEMRPMRVTFQPGKLIGPAAENRCYQELDANAYEVEEQYAIRWRTGAGGIFASNRDIPTAHQLHWMSPHSPTAAALYILGDWAQARQHAKEWTDEFPGHPLVNAAFATAYSNLQQYDKAEPYWRAYLRVAPDMWAYQRLAQDYLNSGHEDKWLQTLQEVLKQPDYSLDHANIETVIANHFMAKGDYKTAEPYADDAAQSWAFFALGCAAECHEGLKEWDKAVALWRACAERYGQPAPWYMLVRRCGHGNLAEARQMMFQTLGAPDHVSDLNAYGPLIDFYLTDGDLVRAVAYMKQKFEKSFNPWDALNLMVVDLKQHDAAAARKVIDQAVQHADDYIPPPGQSLQEYVEMARILQPCLVSEGKTALDLKQVEKTIVALSPDKQADLWYIVGEFLQWLGRQQEAATCLRRAADAPYDRPDVVLALDELRRGGVLPPSM